MGLDTVELVMAVEEEFGIEIPNEDAEKMTTVGQVYTYVRNRLSKTTPAMFDSNCILQAKKCFDAKLCFKARINYSRHTT